MVYTSYILLIVPIFPLFTTVLFTAVTNELKHLKTYLNTNIEDKTLYQNEQVLHKFREHFDEIRHLVSEIEFLFTTEFAMFLGLVVNNCVCFIYAAALFSECGLETRTVMMWVFATVSHYATFVFPAASVHSEVNNFLSFQHSMFKQTC